MTIRRKTVKNKKGFKKDPVCGMVVPEHDRCTTYRGVHYAFCSNQCRERFLETPHLYIGVVGQKAPKQEGIEIIKNRCLRMGKFLDPDTKAMVIHAVNEMMGIEEVRIEGDRVYVRYDLVQAKLIQIERVIEAAGGVLRQHWTDRFRRSWIHFFEANESQAMSVSSGSGKSCH